MKRPLRVCISIAVCLAWSVPSRAQGEATPPAAVSEAVHAVDSLPVTVKLVSTPIQAEAIRAAIESELRVSVRIEDIAVDEGLSVSVKWRRVTVSYRSKQREATTRSLDLPANSEQAVEVIALLAGNLARDEASELLARLAPPPTESATPDVAAPPETAPPVEKPPEEKPPPAELPKLPEKASKPEPKKEPLDGLIRGNPASGNLSFFYPLTILDHTERRALTFEAGFAYSRVGAIEGVGGTIGYLRVEKDVRGAVGSFGLTRVDGDILGVQWGGLFSEGHGKLRGAELGDLAAVRFGDIEGGQWSGLFSMARNVRGAQASAGLTLADDVQGIQAGLVTVARDVKGFQLNLVGVARDTDGAQLGLVNVAKSVDLQLGLVNVAERVDGAAIGLVNIAGNGYVEPTAYVLGSSRVSVNAGVKFVAGLFYSVLAAGATSTGTDAGTGTGGGVRARTEVGGGLHVEPPLFRNGAVVDRSAIEVGIHAAHIYRPTSEQGDGDDDTLHYRAGVGVRFLRAFWLLGGYDVSNDFEPFGENVRHGPWAGLAVF